MAPPGPDDMGPPLKMSQKQITLRTGWQERESALCLGQADCPYLRCHAMIELHEEYLVDERGNRKAVVVPVAEWEQVVELLEELDDIRTYDEVKSQPSEPIPFEQAVSEIREGALD